MAKSEEENKKTKRACVVVLGDIGRSPRMQFHAMSLSRAGYGVDVVGYAGSAPHPQLALDANVRLHFLEQPPQLPQGLPRALAYLIKVVWLSLVLFWRLVRLRPAPDLLLVQNPPSVPTLPVCWLVCRLRGADLVVDWHNYGFSIMALTLGRRHRLVRLCRRVEMFFGRRARSAFCVTRAMSADLMANWGIAAKTLYDRPADMFRPMSLLEKHDFLMQLRWKYPEVADRVSLDRTVFTEHDKDGGVRLRRPRPGFLVSSTSWTEDEDFQLLVEALDEYERRRSCDDAKYPPLVCFITGKGPTKAHYLDVMARRRWRHVQICTPWLEPEDYPRLLACADLGVCLHASSSGLDLPMKVVDMFGCGLPVCALQYNCLEELVRDGENGLTFTTSSQLADHLLTWFADSDTGTAEDRRRRMRDNVDVFGQRRWHQAWLDTALPHLQK